MIFSFWTENNKDNTALQYKMKFLRREKNISVWVVAPYNRVSLHF